MTEERIGENDENLLDVPNLAGNGKLIPQITPSGVEWKNVENKPLFGAHNNVFGAPNNVFGAPTNVFGTPNNVFGAPKHRLFDNKKECIPPFIFDGHNVKILDKSNIKYHEHIDLLKEIRELKREIKILTREKEENLEKIEYLSKFEKRNIILIQQNDKLEEENDILRDEILILKSK